VPAMLLAAGKARNSTPTTSPNAAIAPSGVVHGLRIHNGTRETRRTGRCCRYGCTPFSLARRSQEGC
jgi:hypothetical protein